MTKSSITFYESPDMNEIEVISWGVELCIWCDGDGVDRRAMSVVLFFVALPTPRDAGQSGQGAILWIAKKGVNLGHYHSNTYSNIFWNRRCFAWLRNTIFVIKRKNVQVTIYLDCNATKQVHRLWTQTWLWFRLYWLPGTSQMTCELCGHGRV